MHVHSAAAVAGQCWLVGISDESEWVSACSSLIPLYDCSVSCCPTPPTLSLSSLSLCQSQCGSVPCELQPAVRSLLHSMQSTKNCPSCAFCLTDVFKPSHEGVMFCLDCLLMLTYHCSWTHPAAVELYKGELTAQFVSYGAFLKTCQLIKPINHSGFILSLWSYLLLQPENVHVRKPLETFRSIAGHSAGRKNSPISLKKCSCACWAYFPSILNEKAKIFLVVAAIPKPSSQAEACISTQVASQHFMMQTASNILSYVVTKYDLLLFDNLKSILLTDQF